MRGRLAYRGPDPDDVRGIRGNGREGGARPKAPPASGSPNRIVPVCGPELPPLVPATPGRENRGILPSDRPTTPRPIRPLRRVGTSCSTRSPSQPWPDRLRRPPPHFHPIGSRRTRQVPATPPSPHNTLES